MSKNLAGLNDAGPLISKPHSCPTAAEDIVQDNIPTTFSEVSLIQTPELSLAPIGLMELAYYAAVLLDAATVDIVEAAIAPVKQECPVEGCDKTFDHCKFAHQSLWAHVARAAKAGIMAKEHQLAFDDYKNQKETRKILQSVNTRSSANYRKRNPEKTKVLDRLSHHRQQARREGLSGADVDARIEELERKRKPHPKGPRKVVRFSLPEVGL